MQDPPGPKQNRRILHRSEEHTSELQSQSNVVCRLLLEKKKHRITLDGARPSPLRILYEPPLLSPHDEHSRVLADPLTALTERGTLTLAAGADVPRTDRH